MKIYVCESGTTGWGVVTPEISTVVLVVTDTLKVSSGATSIAGDGVIRVYDFEETMETLRITELQATLLTLVFFCVFSAEILHHPHHLLVGASSSSDSSKIKIQNSWVGFSCLSALLINFAKFASVNAYCEVYGVANDVSVDSTPCFAAAAPEVDGVDVRSGGAKQASSVYVVAPPVLV
ncbi:hypothetical protein HAX54_031568 [Datura stramonium]|uniref:Uncharacterized protein n=1 Tax=Datura stramonium TaxID=4076 RepID=A0ABS8RLR6_DATST|nr:hypothetical protein [Datura stramonium]